MKTTKKQIQFKDTLTKKPINNTSKPKTLLKTLKNKQIKGIKSIEYSPIKSDEELIQEFNKKRIQKEQEIKELKKLDLLTFLDQNKSNIKFVRIRKNKVKLILKYD